MTTSGFTCTHCGRSVLENREMATKNRNHCPYCLYSRHVDEAVGDRKSACLGNMAPIALTFKKAKQGEIGEIMLVHQCEKCGKISINRIAADDAAEVLEKVFTESIDMPEERKSLLLKQGIRPLGSEDREEFQIQLFGKPL